MSALRERQLEFLAGIYADDDVGSRAEIYRRNALANLHDGLAAAYPVVRRLVGEGFFREAARQYSQAHPSRSGDLHRHGDSFAAFLERYAPAADLAYLADVARLEWAVASAYHAADTRAFDYARLAALEEHRRAGVRLWLQPGAGMVESSFPILALWEANQPERDGTPERCEGAQSVLVHRDGLAVIVRLLDEAARDFLAACAAGRPLGEMSADARLAPHLAAQLVEWTRRGVVDGFTE